MPTVKRDGVTRRQVLLGLPVSLAAVSPGFGSLALAMAAAPTARRLVVVILRGALDGVAAVAPYGDPAYRSQRGPLAMAEPGKADGLLDLGGHFGLHPALAPLHAFYRNGQLAVFHAVASPYRGPIRFPRTVLVWLWGRPSRWCCAEPHQSVRGLRQPCPSPILI